MEHIKYLRCRKPPTLRATDASTAHLVCGQLSQNGGRLTPRVLTSSHPEPKQTRNYNVHLDEPPLQTESFAVKPESGASFENLYCQTIYIASLINSCKSTTCRKGLDW